MLIFGLVVVRFSLILRFFGVSWEAVCRFSFLFQGCGCFASLIFGFGFGSWFMKGSSRNGGSVGDSGCGIVSLLIIACW